MNGLDTLHAAAETCEGSWRGTLLNWARCKLDLLHRELLGKIAPRSGGDPTLEIRAPPACQLFFFFSFLKACCPPPICSSFYDLDSFSPSLNRFFFHSVQRYVLTKPKIFAIEYPRLRTGNILRGRLNSITSSLKLTYFIILSSSPFIFLSPTLRFFVS